MPHWLLNLAIAVIYKELWHSERKDTVEDNCRNNIDLYILMSLRLVSVEADSVLSYIWGISSLTRIRHCWGSYMKLWQQNILSVCFPFTRWMPWSEWIISCLWDLWGAGLYLYHDTFFHAFSTVPLRGCSGKLSHLSFSFAEVKQLIVNWGDSEGGCVLLRSVFFSKLRML